MRLPRITTRWLMVFVGGIALVFGVAVEIRRALNRRTRAHTIVAYSAMEAHWLQGAERAQAEVRQISEREHYLLDLVRTGEMSAEEGQRRAQARRRQREPWEAERDRCIEEARWCAERINRIRMEAASGTLFDLATERLISSDHTKKSESAIKRQASSPKPLSPRTISTSQP